MPDSDFLPCFTLLYLWLQLLQHKTIPCWCSILASTIGAGPPDPWCQQQPLCIQSIAPQDRSGGGWTQTIERFGTNLQISSGDMWPLNPYKSCARIGETKTLSAFMRKGSVYEPFAPDCYFDIVIHHNCSTLHPWISMYLVERRALLIINRKPRMWVRGFGVLSYMELAECRISTSLCWVYCSRQATTTGSSIQ